MVNRGIVLLFFAAVCLTKNCCDAQNVQRTWKCARGMRKTNYFQVGVDEGVCDSCGESCCENSMGKRIYNGNDVKEGEFPWSVALFKALTNNGVTNWNFTCGGVLIRHNEVATAAHCVKQFVDRQSLGQIRVAIGETDIHIHEDGLRKRHKIASLKHVVGAWIAPHYTENSLSEDFAILTISGTTRSTPHVCLRTRGEDFKEQVCWGIGHGHGKIDGTYRRIVRRRLQKSQIKLDTNNTCLTGEYKNDKTMLCASFNGRNVNCLMDSGSPVVCRVEPNNPCSAYYLAGLFSAHETTESSCEGRHSVLTNLISTEGDPLVTRIPDLHIYGFREGCTTLLDW